MVLESKNFQTSQPLKLSKLSSQMFLKSKHLQTFQINFSTLKLLKPDGFII